MIRFRSLVCALALPTVSAAAQVMSAGSQEITRLELSCGSGASIGPAAAMDATLAQNGSGVLQNGGQTLTGGFEFGGASSVVQAHATLDTTGGPCPPPAAPQLSGVLAGVAPAGALCVAFDKPLLPSSLAGAVNVTLLRDKDGNPVNRPLAVQTDYRSSPSRVLISTAAGWSANSLISVSIATQTVDEDGVPLASSAAFTFLTLADPSVPNTFAALDGSGASLTLAPSAMPATGQILVKPPSPSDPVVAGANAKLKQVLGGLTQIYLVQQFDFVDANFQKQTLMFDPGMASLSLPYTDRGDGTLLGTNPPAKVRDTQLYVLDETADLWVRLPGSRAASGKITSSTPHLSTFALITAQDASVSAAYAYPVPYRPNGPAAGTAAGQTGTSAGGITFTNLPDCAVVEVFNIRGERVWRGEDSTGFGKIVWNVKNDSGQDVALGVYFYLIHACGGSDTKTGKLAIIR